MIREIVAASEKADNQLKMSEEKNNFIVKNEINYGTEM